MDFFIVIIIVWAAVSLVLTPIIMNHPSQRKRYEQMDDRKLVATHVQAKMLKRSLWIIVYLVPLSLGLCFLFLLEDLSNTTAGGLVLSIILLGVAGARFCREIERLAATEMEFRRFKMDKDAPNKPLQPTS